jgi:Cytochrome c554 and c-prime
MGERRGVARPSGVVCYRGRPLFSYPRAIQVAALCGAVFLASAPARGDRAFQADASIDRVADGPTSSDATNGDASVDRPGTDTRTDAPGIFLPGTQPHELTQAIRPSGVCVECHGQYAVEYEADSTWKGTMMANAARDPLFHAALTVANQDEPISGDLCIRCHAPRAWLFGRSEPALISNLEEADFESVQCDFCHRLNTGPTGTPYIGNGQYFVANDVTRRGPIRDPKASHDSEYSSYHEESRICGLCHDVSNPLRNGFALERTYTEWLTSAYATEGQSCQSCHMPATRGFACGAPDMPLRDVHSHEFAGGNYWMPRVLAKEHPELGLGDAYEKTAKNAEAKLQGASEVTLQFPARATAGDKIAFQVRVENKTGHKLPTGYPEGRRMWLEVEVKSETTGATLFQSGGYDLATATRADDPQLRTYEVRMAANGVEGFHFILQDTLLQDNRIPPRGFVPRSDTKPVGRNYPTVSSGDSGQTATLAHWDDAPYELTIPKVLTGPMTIRATLWYQTTSHEYIEALKTANRTDDYGQRMEAIWQRNDRAPPFSMATATGAIEVDPAPPEPEPVGEPVPEPSPEGGTARDGSSRSEPPLEGGAGPDAPLGGGDVAGDGCSCSLAVPRGPGYQAVFGFVAGLVGWVGRSRGRRSIAVSVHRSRSRSADSAGRSRSPS